MRASRGSILLSWHIAPFSGLTGGAGDPHNAGDLLDPPHDRLQLLAVGHVRVQRDEGKAVRRAAGIQGGDMGLGAGQHRGDVHDQVQAILGHHLQRGAVAFAGVAAPRHVDPASRLLRLAAGGVGVGAVRPVDGDAVAPGDEAHDLVAGYGGAALGELHKAVGQSLHHDALLPLGVLGYGGTGLLGLVSHRHLRLPLRLMLVENALDILPQTAHDLQGGHAAVADGGVHIVQ